jgi:hypothetical protein
MLRSFSKLASPARGGGVSMTMLQWLNGARTSPSTLLCAFNKVEIKSFVSSQTKNRLKFSHKLSRRLGYVFLLFLFAAFSKLKNISPHQNTFYFTFMTNSGTVTFDRRALGRMQFCDEVNVPFFTMYLC